VSHKPKLSLRAKIEALAGTPIDGLPAGRRLALARQVAGRNAASTGSQDHPLLSKTEAGQQRQLAKLERQLEGYRAIVNDLPPALRLETRSRIARLEERIEILKRAA